MKGQLLDLRRLSDGSFKACLLGVKDPLPEEQIEFDSSFTAQRFISWWYQPEARP